MARLQRLNSAARILAINMDSNRLVFVMFYFSVRESTISRRCKTFPRPSTNAALPRPMWWAQNALRCSAELWPGDQDSVEYIWPMWPTVALALKGKVCGVYEARYCYFVIRYHCYVTCARLRVVISLFQPQEQSATVLAASLWQDRPCWTLFQYCYAAATFHPRSVAIWKLNCSSERIISTLVTVCSCKSGRTLTNRLVIIIHHHHHRYRLNSDSGVSFGVIVQHHACALCVVHTDSRVECAYHRWRLDSRPHVRNCHLFSRRRPSSTLGRSGWRTVPSREVRPRRYGDTLGLFHPQTVTLGVRNRTDWIE